MRRKQESKAVQKFMVYFMAFIMVTSLFGVIFFGFGGGSGSTRYNGYRIENLNNLWVVNLEGVDAYFTYAPSHVDDIEVDDAAIQLLRGKLQVDVTSDFNDTNAEAIALAQYQLGVTMHEFNSFIRPGYTNATSTQAPIITCADSTQFVPVIYFVSGNETRVFLDEDCVVAEAQGLGDVIRVKDRIAYGLFGIIE